MFSNILCLTLALTAVIKYKLNANSIASQWLILSRDGTTWYNL
jgi:hypothetical protein